MLVKRTRILLLSLLLLTIPETHAIIAATPIHYSERAILDDETLDALSRVRTWHRQW